MIYNIDSNLIISLYNMIEDCNGNTDVAFLNLKMLLGKDFYNLEYTDLYIIKLDWGVYLVLNNKMEFLTISAVLDVYHSCVVLNSNLLNLEQMITPEALNCLEYYKPNSDSNLYVVDRNTGGLIARCRSKSIIHEVSMCGADSIIEISWSVFHESKRHYKSIVLLYDTVEHQIKKEYKAVLKPYEHNRDIICLTDRLTADGKYVWEHLKLERTVSADKVYKHFKLVETFETDANNKSELVKQLSIKGLIATSVNGEHK